MSETDRLKWNARYRSGDHAGEQPSDFLLSAAPLLPPPGKALDLAGGAGRHALWLASQDWKVTLADISETALQIAKERAELRTTTIETRQIDLEVDPLPAGPWNLILVFHYLHRPLFADLPGVMAPGGMLLFIQPTVRNLERHERPPRPFLLQEGEAPQLITGLEMIRYEEGWLSEGRHEARVVARRSE
jgi:SAM-dependent methyltransferase